jgi:hypothetical protein
MIARNQRTVIVPENSLAMARGLIDSLNLRGRDQIDLLV